METPELVSILKGLPERHLRILELSWELVGENGTIDRDKLGFHDMGLKEAIAEAEGYAKATKGAIICLITMARSQP